MIKNRFTRNDDKGCWEKLIGGVPLVYGDYSFYTDGDGTIVDMDGNILVDKGYHGICYEKVCVDNFPDIAESHKDGVEWNIDSILKYYLEVSNNIICTNNEYNSDYEDSIVIKNVVSGLDLDECIPNLLSPKYKWFNPVSSRGLGRLL